MTEFFDTLETRSPDERESDLFKRLPGWLEQVSANAPGWAQHLAGHDLHSINTREKLASLPVLRKSELKEIQTSRPPFAGFSTKGASEWGRVFMSPGPIFEPMGNHPDPWRAARALFAAGFTKGDLIHNTFSYHLTPGGFILDCGARALGCAVIPAGVGNTELQLDTIDHLKPAGYTGTPDFLKILLDKGLEANKDTSSIKRALVSGGALFPSLRREYADRGISVLQCYATADAGVIAYESKAMEGMIVEEDVIVEIVQPGTGTPVREGEAGEVVVTNFNPVYPMIRLATGDLSAVLSGPSPCGRTNMRIKGWLGRADQTAKVKGMFVHPSQIAQIAKKHPQLGRLRLVIGREGARDTVILKAEASGQTHELTGIVEQTVQSVCKVRAIVELCQPGSLPNDGMVIADERDYNK